MQLTVVEHAFRVLKGELLLRPMWHHYSGRTQVHVMVWCARLRAAEDPRSLVQASGPGDEIRKPDRGRGAPARTTADDAGASSSGSWVTSRSATSSWRQQMAESWPCVGSLDPKPEQARILVALKELSIPSAAESRSGNVVKSHTLQVGISQGIRAIIDPPRRATYAAPCTMSRQIPSRWWSGPDPTQ